MIVNSVNSAPVTSNVQSTGGSQDLGKSDFLKLLVTQMQNQDPLNPMSNTDFIAQLAQFNSLEQMQNLNQTMSTLSGVQTLSNTAALIGKTVDFVQNGTDIAGLVQSVNFSNGQASLVVHTDTQDYPVTVDQIVSVK